MKNWTKILLGLCASFHVCAQILQKGISNETLAAYHVGLKALLVLLKSLETNPLIQERSAAALTLANAI